MAPIIVMSAYADDDTNVNGNVLSKEKLDRHYIDPPFASVAVVAEGRDDDDDAETDPGDEEPVDQADGSKVEMRQSNLFVDENEVNDSVEKIPSSVDGQAPAPCAFSPGGLSLMPPPSSSYTSLTPPSFELEDIDIGIQQLDDFSTIMSQIDADGELARQLQEEENKKKTLPKRKVNVVPSVVDSWFGEPLTWEVRANYSKVNDASSSGSDFSDSISSGISMLAGSFKKWGKGISASANDFFVEDSAWQPRRPSGKNSNSRYRNAV